MEEIWKTIADFPDYEISNMGNCRRKGKSNKKAFFDHSGYLNYKLSKNKKGVYKGAHRLVGDAFLPNPDNKPQINHIDGDKTNNKVENLEWCTCSENMKHQWASGMRKQRRHPKRKILCVDLDIEFESMKAAADYFKIHQKRVYSAANGLTKTAGGHTFKFLED